MRGGGGGEVGGARVEERAAAKSLKNPKDFYFYTYICVKIERGQAYFCARGSRVAKYLYLGRETVVFLSGEELKG